MWVLMPVVLLSSGSVILGSVLNLCFLTPEMYNFSNCSLNT